MEWLKRLQEKYRAGKLTKEQYEAKVKDLLEDGDLEQAEYDEALEFDPKEPEGGKLIYSEEDMQRMAINVANRKLRQELKKQGVEIDADNKGLITAVAALAKTGQESDGKGATATEQEIAQLRKDAAKVKTLEASTKNLSLEVAVLKSAGKYQPHNPAQVVRAMSDYADLIEFDDETGLPTQKSVQGVISKLAKTEPNLFKTADGEGGTPDNQDETHPQGGFSSRAPGGAVGGSGSTRQAAKAEEMKNDALQRMGIKLDN
ncbi:hypothetical protein [Paenibacillus agilis]|uniref:Uncharacterized protein n=1 Tax=Paenibacillus agilis TaxID=3020863 RepID=A0A559IX58_9BACL|nr:hypothetical protein [Paenibacillus agilis]TVX92214.1 hypothetical protein FPZ44_03565 [Paenibacillus agilis]